MQNRLKMKITERIKITIGILLFGIGLSYLLFVSIEGFFLSEVAIRVKSVPEKYLVYTGYPKYLICASGLVFSSVFLFTLLKQTYLRLFLKLEKRLTSNYENRFLIPICAFSLTGAVIAYIWQSLISPVYI